MNISVVATQFFLFSPRKLGKIIQFDEHIFQMGWNHQLEWIFTFFFCVAMLFGCKMLGTLQDTVWEGALGATRDVRFVEVDKSKQMAFDVPVERYMHPILRDLQFTIGDPCCTFHWWSTDALAECWMFLYLTCYTMSCTPSICTAFKSAGRRSSLPFRWATDRSRSWVVFSNRISRQTVSQDRFFLCDMETSQEEL